MKKLISAGCALLIFVLLSSCTSIGRVPVSNTLELAATNYREEKIPKYDSPYTACYRNQDKTYDLYIFASPVQYKTGGKSYAMIDNRLKPAEQEGYAYQNKANDIQMQFPKTLEAPILLKKGEEDTSFLLEDGKAFGAAKKCSFQNMAGDMVEAVQYRRISRFRQSNSLFKRYWYTTACW